MNQNSYLKVEGASHYLQISKSMIYKMVTNNEIPYYRVGSRIIFKKDDLDKWISLKSGTGNSILELPELPKFESYGDI